MLSWWPAADAGQYRRHAAAYYQDRTGKTVMQHLPHKFSKKGSEIIVLLFIYKGINAYLRHACMSLRGKII